MSGRPFPALRVTGLIGGMLVGLLIWNLPLAGLPIDGKKCLALSLMAVVWWATKAMDPGISSIGLLLGYCLFLNSEVVPRTLIFQLWTSPTIYLVIGGFLIAAAVNGCGLGRRIAINYIRRFVKSYRDIIVSCYLLNFLLSFMIPHPWPRSFLLISVMTSVIKAAKLEGRYASNVGLAVFAGSIPTAMLLLTGDSSLNPAVMGFAGVQLSYFDWILYMGLPGILGSCLTCVSQLLLFGGPKQFVMNNSDIEEQLKTLGAMSSIEKKTAAVVALAIVLWSTDSLHGLHPAWVALLVVILLGTPMIDALNAASWSQVNLGTLFFLCAALAIGTVGGATGMNGWLAGLLLPNQSAGNPYAFAMIAMGICMVLHMALGSALAVLGIAAPAIISFASSAGISSVAAALIAYTSVVMHWLLPFHHMNLLVGAGEHFREGDALKMGVFQTLVVAVVVLFEVFWWQIIGRIC